MNSFRLLLLAFFITCVNQSVSAQADLVFNKGFVECEDKWVAFTKDKDGKFSYGFIYIDATAGLTLDLKGKFSMDDAGHFAPEPLIDSLKGAYKIRLKRNNVKVAVIPASRFDELKIDAVPGWLSIYKSHKDTLARLQRWGYFYNDFGMSEKALEYLEPGYLRDPSYRGMAVELAFAYNALGKYEKAIPVLNKAIEMDPADGYMYKELSFAHLKTGNLEEAEKIAEKGIEHNKENAMKTEIAYNITYSYFQQKNKEKFEKWAKETRKWATKGDGFNQSLDKMEQQLKE